MAASSSAAAAEEVPQEEKKDGVLFYFGTTSWDIVGKKTPQDETGVWSPHLVAPFGHQKLVRFVASSPSSVHCCVLDADGDFWTWGRNHSGQLGHNDRVHRGGPTKIPSLSGNLVVSAATGRHHTLVLMKDGTVMSFGSNKSGQLGHGAIKEKDTDVLKPTKVVELQNIKQIGCGAEFSAAVSRGGVMYTWGTPENGVLGNGTDGKYFITSSKLTFDFQPAPIIVSSFASQHVHISQFQCGDQHTIAWDTNNKIWTWGFGGYGRLGHGEQKDEFSPRQVTFFGERAQGGRDPSVPKIIAAGGSCCYLVTVPGQIYFWGRTKITGEATMYPKPFYDLAGWKLHAIACGKSSTVVSADSSMISWGPAPTIGELGYGDPNKGAPKSSTTAKKIESLNDLPASQIACGACMTLAIIPKPSSDALVAKIAAFEVLEPVQLANRGGDAADDEEEGGGAAAAKGKRKGAAAAAPAKKGKKK